jgi:uncharacterized protein YjbJ (UPF0337 family)
MSFARQKFEGRLKKNIGKLTHNYELQVRGAIQENRAKLNEKWFKDEEL